jgi:hypothetical protein
MAPTPDEERAIHEYFTPRKRSADDDSFDNVFFGERRNDVPKGAPESSSGRA